MNKNAKTIGAAILAAAMCASFAGCSKKEDNGVYVDKNGNISIDESKFEDHVNSVFGGGNTSDNTPSQDPTASEPESFKLVVSDEIKNADLSSGKIQINNDIFELASKMTVAEFVEKHKDNYDITYEGGTYEERLDYLLEYHNFDSGPGSMLMYTLYVRSNDKTVPRPALQIGIDNVTSPDEKITIDKGVVNECYYADIDTAILPGGFMTQDMVKLMEKEEGFENPNESYNIATLPEFLKSNGFTETEISVTANSAKITSPDEKLCWEKYGTWYAKLCGEKGLNGMYPVFEYKFQFNSNTDKLSYVELDYYYMAFE